MVRFKPIIAGIVCLTMGVAGGLVLAPRKLDPGLKELQTINGNLERSLITTTEDLEAVHVRLERIQGEYQNLMEDGVNFDQQGVYSQGEDYGIGIEPEIDEEELETRTSETGEESQRRGRGGRDRFENMSEEEREQWQQRMEERNVEREQRREDNYLREVYRYEDASWQERVVAIEKNRNDSRELFRKMRESEIDEQRDLIREEMRDLGDYTRVLQGEQREYMKERLAKKYGVTNGDAFSSDFDEIINSSSFSGRGSMMGGFGRRGGGSGGGEFRGMGRRGGE